MKEFIIKHSNNKSLFILVILYTVLSAILLINVSFDNRPIDLRFAYSAETAYQYVNNHAHETRVDLMVYGIVVDILYPIITFFLLSFSLVIIFKNIDTVILPTVLLIVDYIENFGIITMMYMSEDKSIHLASVINGFTMLKWFIFGICICVIFYGSMRKLNRKYKNK